MKLSKKEADKLGKKIISNSKKYNIPLKKKKKKQ